MNKHLKVILILFIFSSKVSFSQAVIKGIVSDSAKRPIPYTNVTIKKDSISSILDYSYSDEKGHYILNIKGKGNFKIIFSSLGYKTDTLEINVNKSRSKIIKDAVLFEKPFSLDEIIIKPDKPIRIKKDTVVFSAQYFKVGNEETVEDLLKKIPGISVDGDGTIKIGNQEIEKLMIDGDDLFERGYKILSKNMPSYPVDKIEVLNNYSNNRLLKGIEKSEKVALNLRLKDDFKRIWFGHINSGYGLLSENIYDTRVNLANFGKKNKYYFIGNLNNTGYDATGDIESLIRPFRSRDEPASIGDNQSANSIISLSPNQINFKQRRTNFNNAELVSLNAIFNLSDKLKIKTLGFFNWDEISFFRNSLEVVDVNGANFTNTQDYVLRNKKRIAFGKLDFIYNISDTKMLEATTKYNNADFDDGSNLIFNDNSSIENLKHQNTLYDQKINYTNKLKDKKVLLLTGRLINEETPQNYRINQFFYKDLFTEDTNANNVSQLSNNKMLFAGANAHLLDRRGNEDLVELQIGNEFREDNLSSTFSLLEDKTIIEQPQGYQNNTSYQVNDLYFKSKYRFKIKKIGITGKLDFHQIFSRLENNQITTNQNPFFINPSIGLDWEINDKNKIIGSYSFNTTNAKILDVYSDFILTGFRSFSKGTGSFNQLDASSLIFNYQLGNWSDRFFANTIVLYSKNHDFFSTNTLIEPNFTQSEQILINDREFVSINTKFDYYFKFVSSNLKLDLGFAKSEFRNIVNNSSFREVTNRNYNYGLELRSGFKGIFNYHIGTKWTTSEIKTTIENRFTDNISFLDLSFLFNNRFDAQIQTERYFFGNLQQDNTYYFFDFNVRYKFIKKKLTFSLSGKNIFDIERFRNFSISDIGTSTTEYRLLPRFVILKAEYRF